MCTRFAVSRCLFDHSVAQAKVYDSRTLKWQGCTGTLWIWCGCLSSHSSIDVSENYLGAAEMEPYQQAIAEQVAEEQRHHGKAQFFWVWAALLVMTAIEVYLTYQNMQPVRMLTF